MPAEKSVTKHPRRGRSMVQPLVFDFLGKRGKELTDELEAYGVNGTETMRFRRVVEAVSMNDLRQLWWSDHHSEAASIISDVSPLINDRVNIAIPFR